MANNFETIHNILQLLDWKVKNKILYSIYQVYVSINK